MSGSVMRRIKTFLRHQRLKRYPYSIPIGKELVL